MTGLHLLARWPTFSSNQERLARELLRAGAGIDTKNGVGETPLLHLCRRRMNCAPTAQLFLELGASVATSDVKGWTPLHAAAQTDNIALIAMLVAAGAPLDAVAGRAGTPLP